MRLVLLACCLQGLLALTTPPDCANGHCPPQFKKPLEYEQYELNQENGTLFSAGHSCSSDDQCDNGLKCLDFYQKPSEHRKRRAGGTPTGVCSLVVCPGDCDTLNDRTNLISCPKDSYILERDDQQSPDTICCLITCNCSSSGCEHQPRLDCPIGQKVVRQMEPGQCCDTCLSAPNVTLPKLIEPRQRQKSCSDQDNKRKEHGTNWTTSDCKRCHCTDGVAVCNVTDACPLPHKCATLSDTVEPGACCPKCQHCLHERRHYEHLENWINSDCQSCTCTNGQVKCQYRMCKPVVCTLNERKHRAEGDCCERCVCELNNCPYGLLRDDNGFELCQCALAAVASPGPFQDIGDTTTGDPLDHTVHPTERSHLNRSSRIIGIVSIVLLIALAVFAVICYKYCQSNALTANSAIQNETEQDSFLPQTSQM